MVDDITSKYPNKIALKNPDRSDGKNTSFMRINQFQILTSVITEVNWQYFPILCYYWEGEDINQY